MKSGNSDYNEEYLEKLTGIVHGLLPFINVIQEEHGGDMAANVILSLMLTNALEYQIPPKVFKGMIEHIIKRYEELYKERIKPH